jgi:hypothetical protein
MIRFDRIRSKILAGAIELLRQCKDAGPRRRGDPLLDGSECDLCRDSPQEGRLLVSNFGLGHVVHDDGTVDFRPWRVEDPRDGMFWICNPCFYLLAAPEALLRRLLDTHKVPRN